MTRNDLKSCQEAVVEKREEEQDRVEGNSIQAVALIQWVTLAKKGAYLNKEKLTVSNIGMHHSAYTSMII